MRFSTATTIVAVSTLALLSSRSSSSYQVSAALTSQERAALELKDPSPNFCAPCLQKAMHNHFPHACAADFDSEAANFRPEGSTDEEERCVCVAYQDLYWMKADCSQECPYVHNNKTMSFFLPAEKIEGCDKWIDFEQHKEKVIEGWPTKSPDHKPEVFEIVTPAPDEALDVDEDEAARDYTISVSITTKEDDEKKAKAKLELESGMKNEIKKDDDIKATPEEENKKDEL
ncbi:hypothetical protein BC939DRAFT_435970 [Gamsiella multidivaricata]|uniref:uncharacterized protein n=1 Tax=Gamsiella multidivaricata TaxID=101098 RepID=UPI002220A5D9|nr:uncharacterized protein BC939DRAFT_435970 [Gamsiella multidivaricata]KAG0361592.1 hypothetical protein BGZ54_009047 [Gamsiella multidivaricata]KAI7831674.1 hypothetical protein BC939DRAFT_435970 [Gamsiella multidivaricata]